MSAKAVKVAAALSGGMTYTNEAGVDLYVVVEEGPNTPEAVQQGKLRTTKLLLKPGESRTLEHASPASRVTASTDTSPAYGKVNFIGGCGTGCEHDPNFMGGI